MSKTLSKTKQQEWIDAVDKLIGTIEKWAARKQWQTHRELIELTNAQADSYQIPQLLVRAGNNRFYVTPVGFNPRNNEGRVDIECFPALARMLLIWRRKDWQLKTDAMISWPEKWSESAFSHILEALTSAG